MNKYAKVALIAPVVFTSQLLSSWTVVSSSEQMTSNSETTAASSSASENTEGKFILRENGDRALKGYGSVTDEVRAFYEGDASLADLLAGAEKGARGLFWAQNKENVYFYTYDASARSGYTSVSMDANDGSFSTGGDAMKDYDPKYTLHTIKKVSYSSDGRLTKWKVDAPVSSSDCVYYVRELVGEDATLAIPGRFYVKADGTEHVTPIETVTITSKDVAWQNTNLNDSYQGSQFHYVAFDTDIKMESVSKIEIEYQAKYFGGKSDLTRDSSYSASDISNVIKDVDWRDHFTDAEYSFETPIIDLKNLPQISLDNRAYSFSYGGYDAKGKTVIHEAITPSVITATYETGFWWWKTSHTYNMTTLSTYEDLVKANPNEAILSDNNLASKHEWFCCFLQNEFTAACPKNRYIITPIYVDNTYKEVCFGLSFPQLNHHDMAYTLSRSDFDVKMMPIDIMNLSVLKLTYEKDGITHDAVALDTYDDSKGTSNIVDPTVDTPLSGLEEFFNKVGDWFGEYGLYVVLGVLAVLAIILLPALGNFFSFLWKIIKLIGKALWWVISAPFKGIKKIIDKAQGERE